MNFALSDFEARVLWKLEAQLERNVAAVVAPNYDELLADARKELGD